MLRLVVAAAVLLGCVPVQGADNLLANGGFEEGLSGWGKFWSRTPGGQATLDTTQVHGGAQAVRIEHTGSQDWSFPCEKTLEVKPGEIYELVGWVHVEGRGEATLGVILSDAQKNPLDWSLGRRSAHEKPGWQELHCRFAIPPGGATILPRLTGAQAVTVWLDDVSLTRTGTIPTSAGLPAELRATSTTLDVTLHTADVTLTVEDRRTGKRWVQKPLDRLWLLDATAVEGGFDLRMLDPSGTSAMTAALRLHPEKPELSIELSAEGEMLSHIAFPAPFVTEPGTRLILPVNEGISYPVDDATLGPMWYSLYSGHGLCMAWWGVTDGRQGVMAIVDTPDDAAVQVARVDERLCLVPRWEPQKGQFGPARRLRYLFLDDGGYVAMCKRYRQHAREVGLLKTLAEKRAENPNVDKLIGAVNVWAFVQDGVATARQMQEAGIERILWSGGQGPENLAKLNALGILTSRYDIYQDVQNPDNFAKLPGKHDDFHRQAWPKDLALGPDGDWLRGWEIRGTDGKMYPCGVLCDSRALDYARKMIPEELKTHPYGCRFIDTTTASPWRECYHPDHPMTRSECRQWRMDLLRFISQDCHLVCGCETGHEAAVPYTHYFEGMLSLAPYRVPDSGRDLLVLWDEVPEPVAKFQTGHGYRLPLWELVYHDCLVAQWYWGDYNNKLPSLWDRRDLWNALYGTPPMFLFDQKQWETKRDRFVQSYRATAPIARATGYAEMLSHRWLTEDHAVQETKFANGVTVTVNFGDQPYTLSDGSVLKPLDRRVEGLDEVK